MSICARNAATKIYVRRLAVVMATYIVCIAITVRYVRHSHPAGLPAYAMAVLPALPVVGAIAVIGMYLAEEKDEYLRTVTVQSILWAIGLTMGTLTVWGFLEVFAGVSHFPTYWAFPLFWILEGSVTPFVRMRYR